MAILTNLFGESPFGALEAHGEKVHECVRLLQEAFAHLAAGRLDQLHQTADRIFQLETEADGIRNHLHEMLTSKTLLAIRKEELFNILEQQDSMADRAEDIAATLTYRKLDLPEHLRENVLSYVDMVLRNCELEAGIMSKMDLLVESSFGGRDALTVNRLITELAEREDEVKPKEIDLKRKLLAAGDALSPVEAMLWLQVITYLSEFSKVADRAGNGVRMILRIKPSK